MAEQEKLLVDRCWGGSPKEKLSAGEPASLWVNGLKLGPLHLDFRGLRHLETGITTCCAALLMLSVMMLVNPAVSPAEVSVGISVTFAPPALPVYVQPPCPGPGYIWTPGYWAWDPDYGYYWVPGTWVLAPFPGVLWTPGYWGWSDGVFIWYEGYWGPVVGFYGGINYGFGYSGVGYDGGYWRGNAFYYNKTVNNINVTNITNVYSKTVVNVRP
ncbi:MAG TPA: YXWGXW repeat-containing protein, partial [Candidatus Sulfobium mesophilum]|nr:YXWGXW repeat-containing protein [Candidatus Sulfobium mesophilum]